MVELMSVDYPEKSIYTLIRWETPYWQEARGFFGKAIPRLLKLAEGNYDDVRIVFFFDN